MTVVRSVLLFVLAALAEIGGAWLVWQGVREHRGLVWIGAGVVISTPASRSISIEGREHPLRRNRI